MIAANWSNDVNKSTKNWIYRASSQQEIGFPTNGIAVGTADKHRPNNELTLLRSLSESVACVLLGLIYPFSTRWRRILEEGYRAKTRLLNG